MLAQQLKARKRGPKSKFDIQMSFLRSICNNILASDLNPETCIVQSPQVWKKKYSIVCCDNNNRLSILEKVWL